MSTKKELLEKGIEEGNLSQEQLKGMTKAQIEDYALKHGYSHGEELLKDDLIDEVLTSQNNVGETHTEEIVYEVVKKKPTTFSEIRNVFHRINTNADQVIYNPVAKSKVKKDVGELTSLLITYLNELNA